MAEEIIVNETASLAYLRHHQMIVASAPAVQPASPSTDAVKTDFITTDYSPWGDSNDYPQWVFEQCQANTIIPATLALKANLMSSGGISYGTVTGRDDKGAEIFAPEFNDKIELWLSANNLDKYLQEAFRDMYWFNHAFPDFGLNDKHNYIAQLTVQEAWECRFSRQNPKTGLKDFVFIDANWPQGKNETWSKIRCLDPYWDIQRQIGRYKDDHFIYPLFFSTPGKKYYNDAPWHSVILSKWLEVAGEIPKFKAQIMKNQMHLKYVVYIPMSWWEWKYPGWNTNKYTPEARRTIESTERTNFNNVLTGVENVGKTLFLTYKDDKYAKEYATWKIEVLNSKIDSGTYLEDSQEASSHILFALGVDGTLIGNSPGKTMGAGSGSDKRVAHNIFILQNKPFQDLVLRPLQEISRFNKWIGANGRPVVWRMNNQLITTQNDTTPTNRN